jgi:Flp pilus assembly secretin CpaC
MKQVRIIRFFLRTAIPVAIALQALICASANAANNYNVTLNAGEAYVIKNAGAAEISYSGKPDCFSVQSRADGGLLVLGACRGSGTIKTTQDGHPAVYHVTVNAIANPAEPLKPGKSPPALSDNTPSTAGVKVTEVAGAAPKPAAKSAPRTEVVQVPAAHAEAAPMHAVENQAARVAMLPSQVEAPPLSLGKGPVDQAARQNKYTSDPSAPRDHHDVNMTGGSHPLPNDTIALMTGNSQVFDFGTAIERVSIANSKIADIQVVNPHQLLLVGHKPGFTTLVVWNNFGQYEQRQVRVEQTGHQQVLLNVIVAEVNKTKLEHQGIDWSVALQKAGLSLASLPGFVANPYTSQMNFITPQGSYTGFLPPGGNYYPLPVSSNITYALSYSNSNVSTNTFIEFLEQHQLARILAQPRLLANSGEQAEFLSGGEIPIVIAQALNTSIVFKQFGTSVKFVPTVIGRHEIELKVKPEVSKPDYSQGVQLFGFTVPAFITQRAQTDVRMRENQTLIIAGLILDDNEADIRKVPYLGDMPYVGGLFRNTSYNHVRTELVMSVTPRIVGAIPPGGQIALPTERGPMTPQEIRTRELESQDAARPRF